ncbi:MAG TPA: type II toxin-antitoxin system RelE/ParE family toxin [Candidatus Tectomicrobia bacterium]
MSARVVRERLAELDLTEHVTYLARDRPSAALRFIDAVERAFERLAAMPEIGPVHQFRNPRLRGIRMWPVPDFRNYLIFYRIAADEIQILRVLHAARDLESALEEER